MGRQETREQLKWQLRHYVESITEKSKGANMYVCPLCGSGKGSHGTGAFSIKDGVSWKCFSCNEGGDIFDLIGKYEGIQDHSEQLKRAEEMFGTAGGPGTAAIQKNRNQTKIEQSAQDEPKADYTEFFLQANKDLEKTSYHRGISSETLNRFKVGFVENWKHPKAPAGVDPSPRLIIPTSKESYLARDTREDIPEKQKDYAKSKVGAVHTFNAAALWKATQPIFVVEGEIDSLSIIDAGGEAIALGSAGRWRSLLETLKKQKPVQPLIVSLDNDRSGEEADDKLSEGLQELGIPFYRINVYGDCKDANEALVKDREAFRQAVEAATKVTESMQEEEAQAQREAYVSTYSAAGCLQSFINGIADSVNTPCIPTGFKKLDTILDGGLYEGLYTVGAISSLGKTTFVLQVADQIARSGHDVLIFSLEMSRSELMAKSISRHTIQRVTREGGSTQNAKTVRGITDGKRYEKYSRTEQELINGAIADYSEYADRIYIIEGIGNIGVQKVREDVEKHIHLTGNTPVVVVDYLQILAPYSEKASDKQNTDKAILELKRLSRDKKTPVIAISSFNRTSYKETVGMAAFKESGAIEYSSDVLIGLQLKGVGKDSFDENKAKRADARAIELVMLKNRNGQTGDTLDYKYYALFNYFTEE